LYADELERLTGKALLLEAQRDHFSHALHELIERSSLGMTTVQRRNGGYVIAFRVPFDDDIKIGGHAAILSQMASCCLTAELSCERRVGKRVQFH